MAAQLVSLVVPSSCFGCGGVVAHPAEALCPACRAGLPWLRGPLCPRCALPAHGASLCPAAGGPLDAAWAPLAHEGVARAIVHAVKFRGALRLVGVMAAQVAANAPNGLLDGAVLVPVPAHPARRRARGFDHAARLAAAVGGRTGLPVAACLRRSGTGRRQVGATRAARVAGGRVEVRLYGPPPPGVVALVDDVHTTGGTLRACAVALRAGGAGRVVALTYARALSSAGPGATL